MESRTHLGASRRLCGVPRELAPGRASATLEALAEMAVDERGLVHGGFVFGLADYAAMLAVNDPNVVLGAADCRFLAPVRVGDRLIADARQEEAPGRKRSVAVTVRRRGGDAGADDAVDDGGGEEVLSGRFTCFVLDRHVLDKHVLDGRE